MKRPAGATSSSSCVFQLSSSTAIRLFADELCVVVAALMFFLTTSSHAVPVSQVLHRHLPRLQPSGRLPASTRLNLVIGLPLRNQEALTNLLQQIYDPSSSQFHRYLTSEQFAQRFGPTEQDYQATIAFARANGLTVTGLHPNRTLVDVNGSVATIERVFHVTMRTYPHPTEAREFYAPDVDPSLDLTVPLLSISGLDNYALPYPLSHVAAASAQSYWTGSGTNGTFIGYDFRNAYAPGVWLTGTGQAVALFELDGYYASDITNYEGQAGLPNVTVTNILLDGFNGKAGANNIEVALDIEMAISMAPGLSEVMVYEGISFDDVLNQIATDDQASQISSSWGFTIDANAEQIFQQYAAQGQSFFQGSGDSGAYSGTVAPPADDPLVTCVGGTQLTTSSGGGPWSSETTWSGSGGGISQIFAIPSWQQGVNMAGNQGSTFSRNVPDVSMIAAGVLIVAGNGIDYVGNGTSISAPLWAAFTALVNQRATDCGHPPLGFLNPLLYTIGTSTTCAAAFHDITTGNNTSTNSPGRFFAVPGFDLCTGWGTPTGRNLIYALVALDVLMPTPAPFTITGIAQADNDILLTWETTTGATNVVQVSQGDEDGGYSANFANLSPTIISAGGGFVSTNYLDVGGATSAPSRYYRVKITVPPPSDDTGNPTYAGGWFYGDTGGTGFGPWVFTGTSPINSVYNGFYLSSSTNNAGGGTPGIDVAGESWGIHATSNNFATAYRTLAYGPLQVGQSLFLSMDNGHVGNYGAVGFALRTGDAVAGPSNYSVGSRFQFYYVGGVSSYYQTVDASGTHNTGVPFTGTGLRLVFTLTATNTYTFLVINNASGATNTFSGTLAGSAGGTIDSLALFNFNAGSSPDHDCFFNSFRITGP